MRGLWKNACLLFISSHLTSSHLLPLTSFAQVFIFPIEFDLLFGASVDPSTSFSLSSIQNCGGFEDRFIIRINPFINRFIQFNLRWWQKMSYFSSFLVNLSCFYRVFFKFRHLARVFFKIEWMFSAWLTFFFSFLYTDSQISIKKERSGFAPLFETVQNAIKFW